MHSGSRNLIQDCYQHAKYIDEISHVDFTHYIHTNVLMLVARIV